VKKYIWIVALVVIIVLVAYLLRGWIGKTNKVDEQCTLANAKVELFQKAIGEFGALTPEDTALLWSKGVQERNGALQYAVMSDELKKAYKEHLDKNYPAWVTGFSSPWVEKYEIIESKRVSKGEYEVTVQLSLATSAGSEGKHLAKLSVYNDGQFWVLNNVAADEVIIDLSALNFLK
jgi:uncharacterized membrane protein